MYKIGHHSTAATYQNNFLSLLLLESLNTCDCAYYSFVH